MNRREGSRTRKSATRGRPRSPVGAPQRPARRSRSIRRNTESVGRRKRSRSGLSGYGSGRVYGYQDLSSPGAYDWGAVQRSGRTTHTRARQRSPRSDEGYAPAHRASPLDYGTASRTARHGQGPRSVSLVHRSPGKRGGKDGYTSRKYCGCGGGIGAAYASAYAYNDKAATSDREAGRKRQPATGGGQKGGQRGSRASVGRRDRSFGRRSTSFNVTKYTDDDYSGW